MRKKGRLQTQLRTLCCTHQGWTGYIYTPIESAARLPGSRWVWPPTCGPLRILEALNAHLHTHTPINTPSWVLFYSFQLSALSVSHSLPYLSTSYVPHLKLSVAQFKSCLISGSCLSLRPSQPSRSTQLSLPNWFILKLNPSSTHSGLWVWSPLSRARPC